LILAVRVHGVDFTQAIAIRGEDDQASPPPSGVGSIVAVAVAAGLAVLVAASVGAAVQVSALAAGCQPAQYRN
jgi:hypothetical protein